MSVAFDFLNRFFVVTGAGKGLGRDVVLSLLHSNARVLAVSRTRTDLEDLSASLDEDKAAKLSHLAVDVSDHSVFETALKDALEQEEQIHGLVNCAGIARLDPLLEMTSESFDDHMDTNLGGPFVATKVVGQAMKDRGIKGSIVNMSSQASSIALPRHTAYCCSKAGLDMLSKMTALELGPYGIRCNSVCPCGAATSGTSASSVKPCQRWRSAASVSTVSGRLVDFEAILLLEDNPCSEHPNYREYVLSRLPWLRILDNKDITAEERQAVAAMSSRTASPLSPASSELYNSGVTHSRPSILSGGDHSFVSCADDSGMAQGGERVRSSNEGPGFQECDAEVNPAADDDDPRRRRGSWTSEEEEEETSAIQRDSARFGSGRCSSIAGGGPLWEGLLRDSTAVPPASRGSGGGHDDTYDLSVSYAVEQQQQPRAGSELLPRDSFMSMHSSSPVVHESPVVVEDSCWRASVDRSRLTSRTRRSSEVPLGEDEEDGRSINVGEDDSLEEKSDNNIVTAVLALLQELDDESMVRVKVEVDRRLAASSRNAAGA
ncbi:hypothetical protein FOZ62_017352 [Perkinsus olseni]|uniref:Ketoreductase domain-containing protein n=1 Tax=Perkinsus olseni TaxID=32597 RepID=A0A7J6RUP2_PEROL|nr:hypothetical protein FOZ62_017352 [Perkinsus olseni]